MFVNLILRILLYFAGLTGLLVMCLKCPTDFVFVVNSSTYIFLERSMC